MEVEGKSVRERERGRGEESERWRKEIEREVGRRSDGEMERDMKGREVESDGGRR